MQSSKKAFAALCMHQGHATVRSGSHVPRILSKSASWAGFLDPAHPLLSNGKRSDCSTFPESLLKTPAQSLRLYKVCAHTIQQLRKHFNVLPSLHILICFCYSPLWSLRDNSFTPSPNLRAHQWSSDHELASEGNRHYFGAFGGTVNIYTETPSSIHCLWADESSGAVILFVGRFRSRWHFGWAPSTAICIWKHIYQKPYSRFILADVLFTCRPPKTTEMFWVNKTHETRIVPLVYGCCIFTCRTFLFIPYLLPLYEPINSLHNNHGVLHRVRYTVYCNKYWMDMQLSLYSKIIVALPCFEKSARTRTLKACLYRC